VTAAHLTGWASLLHLAGDVDRVRIGRAHGADADHIRLKRLGLTTSACLKSALKGWMKRSVSKPPV
jgi:hypothetical protein